MTDAPPDPLNGDGLTLLEDILSDVFGTVNGQEDLERIIRPVMDVSVWRDLGSKYTRMSDLIQGLVAMMREEGPEWTAQCVRAIYVKTPGDPELREWVGLYQGQDVALVSAEAFEAARPSYLADRDFAKENRIAVTGLADFEAARRGGGFAVLITTFGGKLRTMAQKVEALDDHKKLHDYLHTVQALIVRRLTRILLLERRDQGEVEEISELAKQTLFIADNARSRAGLMAAKAPTEAPPNVGWIDALQTAARPLATSPSGEAEPLRMAILALRSIVRGHLPVLNRTLERSARDIPFQDLAGLLDAAEAQEGQATGFKEPARAIRTISETLNRTIDLHDRWQLLDDGLWIIEPTPGSLAGPDRAELKAQWPMTEKALRDLMASDPGEWTVLFDGLAESLSRSLREEAENPILIRSINDLIVASRDRFYGIDGQLLNQCSAVIGLMPSLQALIKETP